MTQLEQFLLSRLPGTAEELALNIKKDRPDLEPWSIAEIEHVMQELCNLSAAEVLPLEVAEELAEVLAACPSLEGVQGVPQEDGKIRYAYLHTLTGPDLEKIQKGFEDEAAAARREMESCKGSLDYMKRVGVPPSQGLEDFFRAEISRLAALPSAEYGRALLATATKLEVSFKVLDHDVKRWKKSKRSFQSNCVANLLRRWPMGEPLSDLLCKEASRFKHFVSQLPESRQKLFGSIMGANPDVPFGYPIRANYKVLPEMTFADFTQAAEQPEGRKTINKFVACLKAHGMKDSETLEEFLHS